MNAPSHTPEDLPAFHPLAALAAIAFPGAGHFVRGERARAACIAAGVLSLFFTGLFVGGIDSVDSREDRLWFFGQALVGPIAFGVDRVHQSHFKVLDPDTRRLRSANPDENPKNTKSLGKMNEIGTLFSTVAGMMNLIVILDAAFPSVRRRPGAPA